MAPRWYQELSIPQMQRVLALKSIIRDDCYEDSTLRTLKILKDIGIISPFVSASSKDVRKFQKISRCDPAQFLSEVYRHITGKYFIEEKYKKFYNCNERIILSSIAFMKLPETIMELHERLPLGKSPVYPPKPKPPRTFPKKPAISPYLESQFERPDWRKYREALEEWRKKCRSIVKPVVILPPAYLLERYDDISRYEEKKRKKKAQLVDSKEKFNVQFIEPKVVDEEQKLIEEKDLLMELMKELEMNPRDYPPGRENLSLHWQTWLQSVDEDYKRLEKQANNVLDQVRETIKLIFNPDICSGCCACKEIEKSRRKRRRTKLRNVLVDSIIEYEDGKEYMMGSVTMYSPAPSISGSSENLFRVIPSEERIIKKQLIEAVVLDDKGRPRYMFSRVIKDIDYIPEKIEQLPPLIKNVPSCNCQEADSEVETVISCTENDNCVANKYNGNSFCEKCWHSEDNKVFRDFEMLCRERENRAKLEKMRIDHRTCTERFFKEEEHDEPVVESSEKCSKCSILPERCRNDLFKEILEQIDAEKMQRRSTKGDKTKEYRERIAFFVSGVGETDCIVGGVAMRTPVTISPQSSASELSESFDTYDKVHHHWSVTSFTPKRTDHEDFEEVVDQHEAVTDEVIDDVHQTEVLEVEKSEDFNSEEEISVQRTGSRDLKESKARWHPKEGSTKKKKTKKRRDKSQKNVKMTEEFSLATLMKDELKKMDQEGFLFAKLPECHNVPALVMWIMYREGFKLSDTDQNQLLEKSRIAWREMNLRSEMVNAPLINISDKENIFSNLTKLRKEIESKKKEYYSEVRKKRVDQSRNLWNLMEFTKCPSLSFKKSYFIYQPSKEVDGYLIKPYGYVVANSKK